MKCRSHKAKELGAYLLSRAVPLPICLESATTLVNVPITLQVQRRAHGAPRYLEVLHPFLKYGCVLRTYYDVASVEAGYNAVVPILSNKAGHPEAYC